MEEIACEKLRHTSDEVATNIRKFLNIPLDMPLSPDKLDQIIDAIGQYKKRFI